MAVIACVRMRIVYATLCAAAMALPAPAHASVWNVQPADKTAEELYEAGRKDYRLGRFDEAITKWEAAYDKMELPLLLYNIALAYRQLYDVSNNTDDLRKGKVVLRNFLVIAERDPEVDPADAEKLADEIDELLEQAEDGNDAVVTPPTHPVDDKPVDPTDAAPSGKDPGRTRRIVGGALMGGGGAILLTGVVVGIVYGQQGLKWRDALEQAKQDDAEARDAFQQMGLGDPDQQSDAYDTFSEGRCTQSDGVTPAEDPCSVVIKTYRENGRGSNLVTALSLGIGGGLGLGAIIAGAVVFVQGNKRTKEWKAGNPVAARDTIRVGPRGLGLSVSGRF